MRVNPDLFDEVARVLQACVNSSGGSLPLSCLEDDFQSFYGSGIPYWDLGCDSLIQLLTMIPNIYVVDAAKGEPIVIFTSLNSSHIGSVIKTGRQSPTVNVVDPVILDPVFFGWQAVGDGFLLDVADKVFGYRNLLRHNTTGGLGLCKKDMTLDELVERVLEARVVAPRMLVMIGVEDLMRGEEVVHVVDLLRELIHYLKTIGVKVTLFTVVKPVGLLAPQWLNRNIAAYNKFILSLRKDEQLKCDVIDLARAFVKFVRNTEELLRLNTPDHHDKYGVLSKYGRGILARLLRRYLRYA